MQFAVGITIMFVDERLAGIATTGLYIGNCNTLDIGQAKHGLQIVRAPWTDTNDPQRDLVAWRNGCSATKHMR